MKPKCPSCEQHMLTIKALQQQMLNEVNFCRILLQMPPFESIYSSFLSTPVTTAVVDAVPSEPAIPATLTLESMPPEILDQVASLVSGNDILQLCHAVRYYKYISKAMYAVACAYSKNNTSKPAELWPHIDMRHVHCLLISLRTRHLLGGHSRIVSRHGGSAGIDESHGIEGVLSALPERIVVTVKNTHELNYTDEFIAAVFTAKKTISSLPQKTTTCLFIDATPSIPAIPSIPALESMPPEILDRIASFVIGYDIVHLSHAVRYYKYISKAIFDFGQPLRTRTLNRRVKLFTWPCVFLRGPSAGMLYESTLPVPISHLHVLQTYSKVLNMHDGYAIIDDSVGTEAFLAHFLKSLKCMSATTLHLGYIYFQHCKSDPGSLEMTAKWLVKLRIQELRFQDRGSVPMQIRDILHSMPMLSSLHVQNVEHLAGIALSECKLLRKLTLSKLFHGEESPLELVQQLLNI
ncbi:hypothetical protein BJ741DRAFT_707042 [Chytriomyces cf. hyalinus JEL632]|nr:hypothetical protein BJ741DRAFT_707042 [Chytriomyces cf. hyalinus JEL632]